MPDEQACGVEAVLWNNLGEGWQFHCLCGFVTDCHRRLEEAGADMDDHLDEAKRVNL